MMSFLSLIFLIALIFPGPMIAYAGENFSMKRLETVKPATGGLSPFITGGRQADGSRFPATLTLIGIEKCTSTIVGDRVAITAAHCVDNGGAGSIDLGNGAPLISAVCTHHPSFNPSSDNCSTVNTVGCEPDVALCLSQSSLTAAGMKYEVIQTDRSKIREDTSMVLLGFGCTTQGGTDYGTLYWGGGGIRRLSVDPSTGPDDAFMIVDGGAVLCPGDSGGGNFDQESPSSRFVIGIGARSNSAEQYSRLVQTSDTRIVDWLNKWGNDNGVKICGVHQDATGCRN
jgi:hypothetical protein